MRRRLGAALAATFLSTNVVLSAGGVADAAAVPAGFADSAVVAVSSPTTVEWLPNDRIVVLEQGGRVRIGTTDGAFSTALTIANICPGGERGLLGFTHDPRSCRTGSCTCTTRATHRRRRDRASTG